MLKKLFGNNAENQKPAAKREQDPYMTSAGSLTFKNKLNITDPVELMQCELVLSGFRRVQGIPEGSFDWDHFKSIHAHLFGDVYEWAGEPRTTALSAGGGRSYTEPDKIDTAMEAIFNDLKNDMHLMGVSNEEFYLKSASYYNRINAVHPFRSGNGRAARVLLEGMAMNNGLELDWKKIDRAQWQHATKAALEGNRTHLADCLRKVGTEQSLKSLAETKPVIKPGSTSESAANNAIKLMLRAMKEGKGAGSSFSEDEYYDLPSKSKDQGMDMS